MTQTQTSDDAPEGVAEVVTLLDRYITADRELTREVERIRMDSAPDSRICQATVERLARLLDHSLAPGVRAKVQLEGRPSSLRQAGIVAWARRQLHRDEGQS
jgi:hypothetical protein